MASTCLRLCCQSLENISRAKKLEPQHGLIRVRNASRAKNWSFNAASSVLEMPAGLTNWSLNAASSVLEMPEVWHRSIPVCGSPEIPTHPEHSCCRIHRDPNSAYIVLLGVPNIAAVGATEIPTHPNHSCGRVIVHNLISGSGIGSGIRAMITRNPAHHQQATHSPCLGPLSVHSDGVRWG